jgi:hypothetical protein
MHIFFGGVCIAASLVSVAGAADALPEIMPGTSGDDTPTLQEALSKCGSRAHAVPGSESRL